DAGVFAIRHGAGQMPAAVAEGIELFGIAQIEMGLFLHPFAQALFQGALRAGVERAEGKRIFAIVTHDDQSAGLAAFHRNDGGGQADADGTKAHRPMRGKLVVTPSTTFNGSPMTPRAATMRPPRPSASSA